MIIFETKNKIADEFAHSHIPKLKEISKPLKPFGITYFSYSKLVDKDKFMVLCPHMAKIREKFGYSLDREHIVQPQLGQIQQHKEIALWQIFVPENPIVKEFRDFNINHGISLFRKREGNIYESFHFATTNDNEQILDVYFNNLSILNIFSDYFVNKMSDIIDHQIPGKLIQIESP